MAVERISWTSAELLEQNRRNLLKECKATLQVYEARYELPSSRAEEEMRAGRLRETFEVCDWIITYHVYLALTNER